MRFQILNSVLQGLDVAVDFAVVLGPDRVHLEDEIFHLGHDGTVTKRLLQLSDRSYPEKE